MKRKGWFWTLAFYATLSAHATAAQPAFVDYPKKPIRVIVPFPPGGSNDIAARIVVPAMTGLFGQQLVVDNRSGAYGNIGLELTANAQPDGYTILSGNVGSNAINPTLYAAVLKFNPLKDLIGVTLLASSPNILVCGTKFPVNSLKALIDFAKANPGRLNYTNTYASHGHLSMLELASRAGIDIVNIPTQGGGAAITSLISGEVHCGLISAAIVVGLVQAGRLKAIITTSAERLPELPDVPTVGEAGYPAMVTVGWSGFFVPAKTPRAVVERIYNVSVQAAQRPDIVRALASRLLRSQVSKSPEDFQRFVNDEVKRWAEIIQRNQIKTQ